MYPNYSMSVLSSEPAFIGLSASLDDPNFNARLILARGWRDREHRLLYDCGSKAFIVSNSSCMFMGDVIKKITGIFSASCPSTCKPILHLYEVLRTDDRNLRFRLNVQYQDPCVCKRDFSFFDKRVFLVTQTGLALVR